MTWTVLSIMLSQSYSGNLNLRKKLSKSQISLKKGHQFAYLGTYHLVNFHVPHRSLRVNAEPFTIIQGINFKTYQTEYLKIWRLKLIIAETLFKQIWFLFALPPVIRSYPMSNGSFERVLNGFMLVLHCLKSTYSFLDKIGKMFF